MARSDGEPDRDAASLGYLVPAPVKLAVPWLVTAAVIQIALGVGMRVAERAGGFASSAAAVPTALVMMTMSHVPTLVVAMVAPMRGVFRRRARSRCSRLISALIAALCRAGRRRASRRF